MFKIIKKRCLFILSICLIITISIIFSANATTEDFMTDEKLMELNESLNYGASKLHEQIVKENIESKIININGENIELNYWLTNTIDNNSVPFPLEVDYYKSNEEHSHLYFYDSKNDSLIAGNGTFNMGDGKLLNADERISLALKFINQFVNIDGYTINNESLNRLQGIKSNKICSIIFEKTYNNIPSIDAFCVVMDEYGIITQFNMKTYGMMKNIDDIKIDKAKLLEKANKYFVKLYGDENEYSIRDDYYINMDSDGIPYVVININYGDGCNYGDGIEIPVYCADIKDN
ncbi:MAG: hypothetical protein A2Y17_00590 [Clostridiales bacterium GWF2_38_85]|nr:MAG: hypothetical protein A2Y17_00590 [Clostridiales bacterium GWF2_38_85]HBL84599.1 hypothetical protein [Clostridiales bacterium]